jgi:argininosuccinate lyase
MWKGRFNRETSDLVRRLGESISFDWRLYAHDIRGSIAHSRALLKAGILTTEEQTSIEQGLTAIGQEIARGEFEFSIELEDIHMNIESALTRRIGPAGAKLHTARSRNDQVSLDVRMYCREEAGLI